MWSKKYESCRTIKELQTTLGLQSEEEAIQWARSNVPHESFFQKKILTYLKEQYPNAVVWKQSNGVYSSLNGLPDIAMVHNGQYYAFEVKRPFIGRLSVIQKVTIDKFKKAGAVAYVVTYVSEVEQILKDLVNPNEG